MEIQVTLTVEEKENGWPPDLDELITWADDLLGNESKEDGEFGWQVTSARLSSNQRRMPASTAPHQPRKLRAHRRLAAPGQTSSRR